MSEKQGCPVCGEPTRALSEFDPDAKDPRSGFMGGGVVRLGRVCSNPNCLSHGDEGMAGPSTGDRQRVERLLGGDTGLADGR